MINNALYINDVQYTAELPLPWEMLKDSSIIISGASGLIGTFLTDVIMYRNKYFALNCKVYAIGRDEEKAKVLFNDYLDDVCFKFISYDINQPLTEKTFQEGGYVLHMASNTHPRAYSIDPIGTITTNIIGTHNMLELAEKLDAKRFAFISSNEVYGENRGDIELFNEKYCGYIDCNTLRAGYPESKRCGEALCQAYKKQKELNVVIPRLTRSYGPTLLSSDSKALSQFLHKGLANEDIVIKSSGTQYYSYTYVSDAVSGLITVLFKGKNGEAYNISDESSDIMLKDLAEIIAQYSNQKVIFEFPDEVEKAGFSTATKARLDGTKIKELGWYPKYDIREGIERTMMILSEKEN